MPRRSRGGRRGVTLTAAILIAAACGNQTADDATRNPGKRPEASEVERFATAPPRPSRAASADPESLCTPAPIDTTVVIVSPVWLVGERSDLLLEIEKQDSRRGVSMATSTPIALTLEADSGGIRTFLWESGRTVFRGGGAGQELSDGTHIRYELSRDGELLRMTTPSQLGAGNSPSWTSHEQHMALFSEDLMIYHAFDGVEIDIREILEFDAWLPNPLGGEPIPATGSIEVIELTDADGCVHIELRTVPDGEWIREALLDAVDRSIAAGGRRPDSRELEAIASQTTSENVITGQLDPANGRLRRVRVTQTVTGPGARRVDTKTLTDHTAR